MEKKKIVFAAIQAGGGHMRPAQVISEALHRLYPDRYEITLLDFMKDLDCPEVDGRHKRSWRFLLAHPRLTKALQILAAAGGPLTRTVLELYIHPFYATLGRYLEAEKPDLVFSTHFLNTLAVSRVRRRRGLKVVLINYLTEIFDCNAYWFLKDVDHYLVSSRRVRRQMVGRGYPGEKIRVFPYPLAEPCSLRPGEAAELREALGIDGSRQTLLISFGGEGVGPLEGVLKALVGRNLPLNVVVACGRNEDLKLKLEARFSRDRTATRIIPLGYIDYLRQVIFLADFCYIKPGPATTFEVLSYRKPILFTRSSQLSEEKILRFACDLGVACPAGDRPAKVVPLIERMMQAPFLEACRSRYSGLPLISGAADIAGFIDRLLSGSRT